MTLQKFLELIGGVPPDAQLVMGIADPSDDNDWIIADVGSVHYDLTDNTLTLEEQT